MTLYGKLDAGQDPIAISTVSLPVDEYLESAEVATNPAGQPNGTYLKMVFITQTGEETVYIDLSALGASYSSGNNAIEITSDRKIKLKLSTSAGGLSIESDGLKFTPQLASTTTALEFGQTGSPGTSPNSAREDHTHTMENAPDISGKQDKIAAGATAGHPLLDTTTAGTITKSPGTLTLTKNLSVGAATTYTGPVTIRSAGSSATVITGPNGGTAVLQSGEAEVTSNKVNSLAGSSAEASETNYPCEKAVVEGLENLAADIPAAPSAGNGINVSGTNQISLKVASGQGLTADSSGLKFASGYKAMTTEESTKLEGLTASGGMTTINRVRTVIPLTLADGATFALNYPYKVGSNKLVVYMDGLLLDPSSDGTAQYQEVGTVGTNSSSIMFNFSVQKDSVITYFIYS